MPNTKKKGKEMDAVPTPVIPALVETGGLLQVQGQPKLHTETLAFFFF